MNIKKLFAILAGVSMVANVALPGLVHAATPDNEYGRAYTWAYSQGVTTKDTYEAANMGNEITRAEFAKMASQWAMKLLGKKVNEDATCVFSDIDSVQGDLHDFVLTSCKLGLMGQLSNGNTEFRPHALITRGEIGTVLSRALWGSTYEGATPYFADHLKALQKAGIMKKIDNPYDNAKRGDVMLMLHRTSEGEAINEANELLACLAKCEADDTECVMACSEAEDNNEEKETVVRAGDLEVTAEAAPNKKILASGTSDLDTITFKTSEDVTINKITLERYGYSDADKVVEVRLENEYGDVITEPKSLTKDKVTLSLKKDYRTVDGKLEATLVVTTSGAAGSMGFKVIDADSTAARLNLDDYEPNLYDVVDYVGKTVTVEIKGTDKDYNYEEGESYEIARLKIKAGDNAILVKGFTLTNDGKLDMAEFLDELTVTAEGKDVKGLKYSVNKDDQLVVSFNEIDVDINKSATFVVSASFKDFDDYGEVVKYYVDSTSDVNATEKKNGTRVQLDKTAAGVGDAKSHKFSGGKIKIVNKKLGNVDAAQGSEDIAVAEGTITIGEAISKLSFDITVNNTGVESLKFVINGDEYEGKADNKNAPTKFTFSNVEIEKSGKAQFLVSIFDNPGVAGSVTFSTFNKNAFSGAKYSDANEYVNIEDVAGSISFSKVTIQASKGALENNVSKDVEFLANETTRKVVFDGTYTAKKGDVNLNSFYIDGTAPTAPDAITFYVFVDGEEVGDTDQFGSGNNENFSDVLVEAGKSVKVKVEAEVEAYTTGSSYSYTLVLAGEDNNGNDAGEASDTLVTIKTKESGSVKVDAGTAKNTVLLKAKNQNIAEFTIKPSNPTDEELTLDELVISFTGAAVTADDIRVKIDGAEYDANPGTLTYEPNETIPSNGLTVQVTLKNEFTGNIVMSVDSVNGKAQSRTFSKRYEEALVYIDAQEDLGGSTKFTIGVDTAESDTTVANLKLYVGDAVVYTGSSDISDGETIEVENTHANGNVQMITKIQYTPTVDGVEQAAVTIEKSSFEDYFKVDSSYAKIFASK